MKLIFENYLTYYWFSKKGTILSIVDLRGYMNNKQQVSSQQEDKEQVTTKPSSSQPQSQNIQSQMSVNLENQEKLVAQQTTYKPTTIPQQQYIYQPVQQTLQFSQNPYAQPYQPSTFSQSSYQKQFTPGGNLYSSSKKRPPPRMTSHGGAMYFMQYQPQYQQYQQQYQQPYQGGFQRQVQFQRPIQRQSNQYRPMMHPPQQYTTPYRKMQQLFMSETMRQLLISKQQMIRQTLDTNRKILNLNIDFDR